jgi:thiol-disulfide isomerase/thioredoxin
MKTRHFLFAFLAVGLFACNTEPEVETYKVNVNLANADGQMAYLQRDGQVIDSAVITNWEASFDTPVGDGTETYGLMLKGWRRAFPFFTDNVDVTLEGDAQNPNAIVVTGSEAHDRLTAFTEGFNEYDLRIDSLSQLLKEAKDADNQKQATRLQREIDDMGELQKMYCFDYVWENPVDPVAHYVLYRYKWAFGPCEMRNMIDNIHAVDSAFETYNLTMAEEYVEKQERVQAGQPIIDFTQNDPDGNPVTLSELAQGKLLLVDFWASWCPDCRKANPDLVAAYQKYHDQGFDILGVSFDTEKEKWLAAVEKDSLTWTHVSDLQGWNNAAGALYTVSFIPQNALIKDGMIVARNLEGDALAEEIERQLKK